MSDSVSLTSLLKAELCLLSSESNDGPTKLKELCCNIANCKYCPFDTNSTTTAKDIAKYLRRHEIAITE